MRSPASTRSSTASNRARSRTSASAPAAAIGPAQRAHPAVISPAAAEATALPRYKASHSAGPVPTSSGPTHQPIKEPAAADPSDRPPLYPRSSQLLAIFGLANPLLDTRPPQCKVSNHSPPAGVRKGQGGGPIRQ